ncbi:MAG: sulfatase-like hydrolase/transferase [Acidobacteriota bacterium]
MSSLLRRVARVLPVVLAVVVLAALAWATRSVWWAPTHRAEGGVELGRLRSTIGRDDLNLVVVTLDTTRLDRIAAYGRPEASETPVFDRLAREGVLFDETMTTAPLTLPAHASMFTGRFPPQHGVRDNGGFFLGPDADTLAERLQARGYRTGAFVGAYVLDSKWGLDQGFERYADDFDLSQVRGLSLGSVQRRADEVVDLALPWLETVADERFFAFLHFYDAHAPYDPPEPFASRFRGNPYNGEVAFADAQLGRVVEFLERRGLLDRTIIAVLADHGESLGEHDEGTHGFFIYETATHVPFLIRAPFERTSGRRVSSLVRVVDLMPTLLDLLGAADPGRGQAGRSLVPLMTGDAQDLALDGYAEAMYPLHHYGWSELKALRAGRFKLIEAPRPELFDLEVDPRETTNLFAERRALGERLQAALRGMEAGFAADGAPPSAAADVDPEVRERLAALGYVGSFVATAGSSDAARADPKDKIDLFNLMSEARDLTKGDAPFDAVAALYRQVLAADPQVIDAWFSLGNVYYREGRYDEAIRHFRTALELKPDYDLALINMANAYRALGRDDDALAGYEHYLRVDPKNAWVQYQAGEIHLDRGADDRAAAYFEQALAIDPTVAPARVALGVVAYRRGDLAAAEREIRAALATKPDVRLAHFNLGLVAEARGDVAGALASYQSEIALHDDAYRALFNAARLLQEQGRTAEAVPLFERAIAVHDRFAEGHFYLAQARLGRGDLVGAATAAQAGLAIDGTSSTAPLGYFVLAEVALRQGRLDDASRYLEQGETLERRHARQKPSR